MAYDVFISHSAKDKVVADAVCAALEAEKIRCWIAPRDIRSGENWAETINQAIKSCRLMVLIFSKDSNQSKQVGKELTLAVNAEAMVIPFKIDDILPSGLFEYYLSDTHWLDAMNPPTKLQIQRLVMVVRHNLSEEIAILFPSKNDDQSKALSISSEEEIPSPYMISKKTVTIAAAVILCGLLLFGGISLFGTGGRDNLTVPKTETEAQKSEPSLIAGLDAVYYIDYENGTIPIGALPIGARVVDPSWEWEFRTGANYKGSGDRKPVTWIIVAKDHYDGLEPHVTLLAEELIGKYTFDNSTNRSHSESRYGYNHWGESGTANAIRGLRPWLNSIGIHSSEGFYQAFSDSFKGAVLVTTVPNKEWENGTEYSTKDYVFIPSTTELGDNSHILTYRIGDNYAYFSGTDSAKLVAWLGGEACQYWTRSPGSNIGNHVLGVYSTGEYYGYYGFAYYDGAGVRPAVNLKSEILVSEIKE